VKVLFLPVYRVAQTPPDTRMFGNRRAVNNDNLVVFVRQYVTKVPETRRRCCSVPSRRKTLRTFKIIELSILLLEININNSVDLYHLVRGCI
jgi:hypothetical protein